MATFLISVSTNALVGVEVEAETKDEAIAKLDDACFNDGYVLEAIQEAFTDRADEGTFIIGAEDTSGWSTDVVLADYLDEE